MVNCINQLKNIEFFSHLDEQELKKYEKHLFHRTYQKKQILFTEGDPRERIYFLISGYVKLEKNNVDMTAQYIDYVRPNDLFPYGGMFFDDFYHYSAYALTDILVYYIPTKFFESTVSADKKQLFIIIKRLSSILEHHENRLKIINSNYVKDRVILSVAYLIKTYGVKADHGIMIDVPMTLTEIARLAGTSRVSVSHIFKDLKKENLLSDQSNHIVVHNPDYFLQKL
ncbi:Crp/Fnr family transcriptional regulator [Thermoactinomyces sp. AMNI-1]|uniref:Crp/Fnr family transcriptional regulator n=2 Tax=Thermoactinomyces mirandus TaxID=2756294 RepID=A0A7W1XTM9_9BACL|nr:Crp/Fnr family transcriptional regulator [Thermoactinomyces mirandus]